MSNLSFGQKLLLLRREKKISQRKLAHELGINFVSILQYEKDEYVPKSEILVKLAQYFNVSLDYLLLDKDVPDIKDKELLALAEAADNLSDNDRDFIKNTIQNYLQSHSAVKAN